MKKLLATFLFLALLITALGVGAFTLSTSAYGDDDWEDYDEPDYTRYYYSYESDQYTNGYYYRVDNGKATITYYNGPGGDLVIPSTLGGYPVVGISYYEYTEYDPSLDDGPIVECIGAFQECKKLTSVTIPDSVITIDSYAFYDCNSLTSVSIGKNVKTIVSDAFDSCNLLTSFTIHSANPNYCFVDGVLFNKNKTTLERCLIQKAGSYTIPDSVIIIKKNAFRFCSKITSIVIPNSVTTIEDSAFYCYGGNVNIPSSVTYIGDYAFYSCDGLTKVVIPNGVTTISNWTFSECDNLVSVTIPDSVTYIDDSFQNCPKLASITIGKGVKYIENYAFDNTAYYNNSANWEDDVLYIGQYLIKANPSLPTDYVVKKGTRVIADEAFYACDALSTIILPDSLVTVGDSAFYNCSNLNFVYYAGTAEERREISFGLNTGRLLNAHWHHNTCTKTSQTHYYNDATCTKPQTCRTCGKTTGKALGHKYATVTQKATATANGYTVKRCAVCEDETDKITFYKASAISLSKTSYTYNGKVQKPTVTVKNSAGKKLTEGTSYTVTYSDGCKVAGTYKVTVKFKGNYTGTKTLTYKIKAQDVSKCKISLSATSYTYNSKVKTPTVTVKNASGTKLSTASYTVSYASGRKNVGTYKVTVKMKGNYTGTKTLTFKINPAKTSISKVTAGSKKLTVKWIKKTTQVTGYQVQYSTSKSFSSYKTKTITKNSTTSTTLTGLSAKKTYYIRVRTYKTVNGVKYYSGWTTIKSAKTK